MLVAVLAATAVLDIAAASERPELSHLLDTVGLAVERKLRGLGESDAQFENRRRESIDRLVEHLIQSVIPPNTTRGRRLTDAGKAMKHWVDTLIHENDGACGNGNAAKHSASDEQWTVAKGKMKKALDGFGNAHHANQGAIRVVDSMCCSDSVNEAGNFFRNNVGGTIHNNHHVAHNGLSSILGFLTPVVDGLKWLGHTFFGWLGLFVQRPLTLPTQPPVSPRRRSFLVAAAGLVTLLAAITAGSYRWNNLNKKFGPLEANKMLVHDADVIE